MDPSRSGLIRRIWDAPSPKYEDYVEWSLDAGMFLFRRGDRFVKNTGQTFRDFLHDGFEGERATLDDYKLHLTTLFPEVRLKNTIEVRSADSVPVPLLVALVAVWTGVLYDERALAEADELTAAWRFDDVENARRVWIRTGLHGDFLGRPGFDVAARLLAIARGGLERRARVNAAGQNEAVHLEPIERLVAERQSPADALVARLGGEDLLSVAKRDLRALFLR